MSSPLIKQVAHTCIFAHDIEATETFYREVFLVEPKFRFRRKGKKFGFYFDMGGRTFVEVFEKPESEFTETNQINHICLEAHDLDAFIAHVRSKGVKISDKVMGVDHTWQAWMADPNGVKYEIFQYTDKSMQFGPDGEWCEATW